MEDGNDNDVQTLNLDDTPGSAGAGTTGEPQPEDRGDVVDPGLTPENLAAVVAEASTEQQPSGKPQSPFVPIGRFNEVNQQAKALQAQLEQAQRENEALRAATAAPAPAPAASAPPPPPAQPAFDVAAQERMYAEALMEGDTDKAVEIRHAINAHIESVAVERAQTSYRQATAAELAQQAIAKASSEVVAKYPFLDTQEGADALELICMTRDSNIARGMAPAEALRKAADLIAPRFGSQATPPGKSLPNGKDPNNIRTVQAIQRNVADSNAQPSPLTGGTGNREQSLAVDVATMDEARFDSLSEADKKRLRGDF